MKNLVEILVENTVALIESTDLNDPSEVIESCDFVQIDEEDNVFIQIGLDCNLNHNTHRVTDIWVWFELFIDDDLVDYIMQDSEDISVPAIREAAEKFVDLLKEENFYKED